MTEKETEQNMLMEFIADTCKIDINEKLEYPPVCLSYGEKVLQSDKGDLLIPIALGTFGNLSVITAPPKTRKSFFLLFTCKCLFKWFKYLWWTNKRT